MVRVCSIRKSSKASYPKGNAVDRKPFRRVCVPVAVLSLTGTHLNAGILAAVVLLSSQGALNHSHTPVVRNECPFLLCSWGKASLKDKLGNKRMVNVSAMTGAVQVSLNWRRKMRELLWRTQSLLLPEEKRVVLNDSCSLMHHRKCNCPKTKP